MKQAATGLVLAGGASRRFGSDKSQHLHQGVTMLDHVVEEVQSVVDVVLVSVRFGQTAPEGCMPVVDVHRDGGPLAGIHAGLLKVETPWLLVVACDMPYITSASLDLLLTKCFETSRTGSQVHAVVAAGPDGRRHPLCAGYHRSILPKVEEHLDCGKLAVFDLLGSLERVETVDLDGVELTNVNRQVDLTGIDGLGDVSQPR